ncbi:MAG TPA: TIGR03435 family protein, partial [Candidatus Acidoferrales bacterium]
MSAEPPADSASKKIHPSNPKLPPPPEERLMLRALLADRFQLTLKQTTEEVSGFALVLKDPNPKLSEPEDREAYPVVIGGPSDDAQSPWYLQGINAPMQRLADRLAGMLSVPVVDRTGLTGSYDFVVTYAYIGDENASGPLIKDAIQGIG